MSQYFGDSLHFKTISNLFIYLERSTSEQLSPKLSLSVLLGTLFFFLQKFQGKILHEEGIEVEDAKR